MFGVFFDFELVGMDDNSVSEGGQRRRLNEELKRKIPSKIYSAGTELSFTSSPFSYNLQRQTAFLNAH
jgi:hypothetical protein